MSELTEAEQSQAADRLLIDERQELLLRAATARGIVDHHGFNLHWIDDASRTEYALQGKVAPQAKYMTYSLIRTETQETQSTLRFNETHPGIRTSGPIRDEIRGMADSERQVYLNTLLSGILWDLILDSDSQDTSNPAQ